MILLLPQFAESLHLEFAPHIDEHLRQIAYRFLQPGKHFVYVTQVEVHGDEFSVCFSYGFNVLDIVTIW